MFGHLCVSLYNKEIYNEDGTMTLVEVLERNAKEIPEKTAIIFHDTRISYRELNQTVNRLANEFIDMGLKKGDTVGLMLPRIPELVISFLASIKAHGIAVPINFELTDKNIKTILQSISPLCLVVHSSFFNLAQQSIPHDLQIPIIVVGDFHEKCISWNDIVKKGKTGNPGLDSKADDIVYLNYTSGSTGSSKGAVTTNSNVYWNTIASIESLGLRREDVHLCMFAPFAHPHEIFARPLYLGGTMVLIDKKYPKSLAEAIDNYRVTCVMGLAPIYENLLEVLEHRDYDLSSLKIPESGGMYTRPDLIKRFNQRFGVPVIPVWGSTETTGIALANRPGEYMPQGSVGKPCVSYEVKIVDEDGCELPSEETGEMIFKGPAVVQGYYHDIENSQQSFKGGWYYSGDLGKKDGDGYFSFVERKSGMMKVAGLKVYPQEIERVLMDHPDVKEVAVVSVKDRLRGEVPKAVIVSKGERKLTEKEVLTFCRERMAHYKLPRIIEIRESLPKIGSGKVNKRVLQMEHI